VAVAVEVFYGLDTGIQLHRLTDLSQFVADVFGLPIPATKPLVGRNAFADVTDVHYLYEGFPWVYRAISAELVGNKRRAAVAGVSGPLVLQIKAQELGINLSREQCEALLPKVMTALRSRRGGIPDEEISTIINKETK
jgi:isopropylmalate/homocitrate/citramalate synthase